MNRQGKQKQLHGDRRPGATTRQKAAQTGDRGNRGNILNKIRTRGQSLNPPITEAKAR
jgi:hypothetical protein